MGCSQSAASPGHAPDAPLQLVVDLGPFRVAEIEAIGKGQGFGPGAGQVAANFGDDYLAAAVGVQAAEPAVAVDGQRNGPTRVLDAQGRRRRRRAPRRCWSAPGGRTGGRRSLCWRYWATTATPSTHRPRLGPAAGLGTGAGAIVGADRGLGRPSSGSEGRRPGGGPAGWQGGENHRARERRAVR